MTELNFNDKELIFRKGDFEDPGLYFLVRGKVDLFLEEPLREDYHSVWEE